MQSKYEAYPTGRIVASMGMLLLALGVLIVLTNQPPSLLEPGSGMGNHRMPSGGYGSTTSASNPGSGAGASSGNAVAPTTTAVDVLLPASDPIDNSL